jgi:hypothetical protein
MHLPYTNHFPEAISAAGEVTGVALTAVTWSRSLRTRMATVSFSAAIWLAALLPAVLSDPPVLLQDVHALPILQISALLATLAMLFGQPSRWLKAFAVVGQGALLALTLVVRESDYELAFGYLFWYGLLFGAYLLWAAPPATDEEHASKQSFGVHDLLIFASTVALAFLVTNLAFNRLVFNGDEVANSFQADVYGHFRAFAPIPACPAMFENYWVFRHDGHAFSQYTPGWPLFMALFSRLGVISLAGPVMAGFVAVGVARLSRRLAFGLGSQPEQSERIVAIAGVLGALSAMLGPSMLLNGASRFSHTMVCACFAWAIESLCVISDRGVAPGRALRYGLLFGSAVALGIATRPADGSMLGVGIFGYFCWVAYQRRLTWRAFSGAVLGFAFFAGLTAVILRLQLGEWFQTAYKLAPTIHPEAKFRLSWPAANQAKYGVPLATGSYCWWPAAPALGIAGLVRALGGRERRVAFMLAVSGLVFESFYFLVEFGRGVDDGLGPRYFLPLVVLMAAGGAAILAPLVEKVARARLALPVPWLLSMAPAACVALAVAYGAIRIGPLLYPVAEADYRYSTAPLRGAQKLGLKNAIVIIEHGRSTADEWNLAQNQPMNPDPDVLFLSRHSHADDICARKHFPGRAWYRAGFDESLPRY